MSYDDWKCTPPDDGEPLPRDDEHELCDCGAPAHDDGLCRDCLTECETHPAPPCTGALDITFTPTCTSQPSKEPS